MTDITDRRTRKRLETRQRISDIASRMFVERGFDCVTVDEIAKAADVARMTVFNHFSRKEDMFFDLDEQGRADLKTALLTRDLGISPLEALRRFAHQAFAEQRPYVRFFEGGSEQFLATIQASEALKSRARAIRDELSDTLADALAQAVGKRQPDAAAKLAASMLVAMWGVAFLEAHAVFHKTQNAKKANQAFLTIVEQGSRGLMAAMDDSPYANSLSSPDNPQPQQTK